jgi:hypothetical protein
MRSCILGTKEGRWTDERPTGPMSALNLISETVTRPGATVEAPRNVEWRRDGCGRLARGKGENRTVPGDEPNQNPEDYMKEIPRDIERDVYGEGSVVGELEGEVAKMLGKPAAVFLPMGQQIDLRVHADRRDSRTVLWHPFCHLADNEADGYRRLHGLHWEGCRRALAAAHHQ